MKARRVAIDSVSVFLHKIQDAQRRREKLFHLCSIVQNAQAVGFFATDIPYGSLEDQPLRRRGDGGRRRHHPQLHRGGARAAALPRGLQAPEHGPSQGPPQHGDRAGGNLGLPALWQPARTRARRRPRWQLPSRLAGRGPRPGRAPRGWAPRAKRHPRLGQRGHRQEHARHCSSSWRERDERSPASTSRSRRDPTQLLASADALALAPAGGDRRAGWSRSCIFRASTSGPVSS